MNAVRQQQTGQELTIAVDASYRYVIQRDHGLFVIQCINHAQVGKKIAYAICNKEDVTAIKWIILNVKAEIKRIVNERIKRGDEWF